MSYQLELRHVRYFLAVAEDLHFRKAASRLFISQPGLSRQIMEMEEGLGIRLFERHSRKVTLTKAGQYLKTECARLLKEMDNAAKHAKLLHDGLQGDIKLGYVGSAMQDIIPKLLLALQRKYPKVLFNLKEMDNQDQIDGLLSHELDVGFVRLQRIPKGLEVKSVLDEPFCLVLPAAHQIAMDNFQSIVQLANEPFILFDPKYSPSYYEKVMQIFDDHGFSPIVTHNTIHAGSIYKLVENGFGISIVPRSLHSRNTPGVKFIELNDIPQRTVLSAVWHSDNRNPVLEGFLVEMQNLDN